MSEPFSSFGNNFRVFYSTLMAFSTTIILGALAIVFRNDHFNLYDHFMIYFKSGIVFLGSGLITCFIMMLVGLLYEKEDGSHTTSKGQRDINRIKFRFLVFASFLNLLGAGLIIYYFLKSL